MDRIDKVEVIVPGGEYTTQDTLRLKIKFSVLGESRDGFTEDNWTKSYEANDVAVKIKYGVKMSAGGIRKKNLGSPIEAYRKAAIFWTRNPKLVNPMKEKRIWVQVAKNFMPIIRLSEEEIRQELFDFEEEYAVKCSELGKGSHGIGGEVHISWQKHHLLQKNSLHAEIPQSMITIY